MGIEIRQDLNVKEEGYEVWIEGYSATGEHDKAHMLTRDGESYSLWKAVNFKQACVYALNDLGWQMSYTGLQGYSSCYYNLNKNSYWARRFYDNEVEARKSFG